MPFRFAIRLTVADTERDCFCHLAVFPCETETQARKLITAVDQMIDHDSEPDAKTAAFVFILDLIDCDFDLIDTGTRLLPLQIARQIAPLAVDTWLASRPDDHAAYAHQPPILPLPDYLQTMGQAA